MVNSQSAPASSDKTPHRLTEVHDAGLHGNANPLNSYRPISPAQMQCSTDLVSKGRFSAPSRFRTIKRWPLHYKAIGQVSACESRALATVETTPTEPLHPPMLTACPAAISYPLALCSCASAPLSSTSRTAAWHPSHPYRKPCPRQARTNGTRSCPSSGSLQIKAAAQGPVRPLLPELMANLPRSAPYGVRKSLVDCPC